MKLTEKDKLLLITMYKIVIAIINCTSFIMLIDDDGYSSSDFYDLMCKLGLEDDIKEII